MTRCSPNWLTCGGICVPPSVDKCEADASLILRIRASVEALLAHSPLARAWMQTHPGWSEWISQAESPLAPQRAAADLAVTQSPQSAVFEDFDLIELIMENATPICASEPHTSTRLRREQIAALQSTHDGGDDLAVRAMTALLPARWHASLPTDSIGADNFLHRAEAIGTLCGLVLATHLMESLANDQASRTRMNEALYAARRFFASLNVYGLALAAAALPRALAIFEQFYLAHHSKCWLSTHRSVLAERYETVNMRPNSWDEEWEGAWHEELQSHFLRWFPWLACSIMPRREFGTRWCHTILDVHRPEEKDELFRYVARQRGFDERQTLNMSFHDSAIRCRSLAQEFCEALSSEVHVQPADTSTIEKINKLTDSIGNNSIDESKLSDLSGDELADGVLRKLEYGAPPTMRFFIFARFIARYPAQLIDYKLSYLDRHAHDPEHRALARRALHGALDRRPWCAWCPVFEAARQRGNAISQLRREWIQRSGGVGVYASLHCDRARFATVLSLSAGASKRQLPPSSSGA